VLIAPFDYPPRPGYSVQPDVMVARRPVEGARLEVAPVLAVEVLSPSSRAVHRTLKRLVYEENGVEHYWLVDPAGPSVTALQLVDGSYRQVAEVQSGTNFATDSPVQVAFDSADLLDE
jgi:Uma2 family endonuclease